MPSVHRQTFVDLVKANDWKVGAEIGVDRGILTGLLLRSIYGLRLTAVDRFPDRQRSRRVFEFASEYPYLRILDGDSVEMAQSVADEYLDFVFIDADHSYEGVKEDIAAWAPKVKPGGWIGGHDYHPKRFPGVVQAVSEAFPVNTRYPGTIWGVFR